MSSVFPELFRVPLCSREHDLNSLAEFPIEFKLTNFTIREFGRVPVIRNVFPLCFARVPLNSRNSYLPLAPIHCIFAQILYHLNFNQACEIVIINLVVYQQFSKSHLQLSMANFPLHLSL